MPEQRLVVFIDYTCPFSRLAGADMARLSLDAGVAVDGAAFELRPAGTLLPDVNAPAAVTEFRSIAPMAAERGVVMKRPLLATRTRKAHEAAAFARSVGRYIAMQEAIYDAFWRDGRDIGRIDVLVAIGQEIGLDPGALRVALDIDQWTERVEQDVARAHRLKLSGVPAWVMEHGAQAGGAAAARIGLEPYEELKAWVEHGHDI